MLLVDILLTHTVDSCKHFEDFKVLGMNRTFILSNEV